MKRVKTWEVAMIGLRNPIFALAALSLTMNGCGGGPGESASATAGDTEGPVPPPPGEYCAVPQFATGGTGGESYTCAGKAQGHFTYRSCDFVNGLWTCGIETKIGIGADPTEGDPLDTVVFPPDPTEGEHVKACCKPAIEEDEGETTTTGGEAEGEAACLSDCANAVCLEAIQQLQALLDDLDTTAAKCPKLGRCKQNVKDSLTMFKKTLEGNFDLCVATVADPKAPPLRLGTPDCGEQAGCLVLGELPVKCTIETIDFTSTDSTAEMCSEALHQPPDVTRESGPVAGGTIVFTGAGEPQQSALLGTYVQTARFACDDPLCPLTLEKVEVVAQPVNLGLYSVANLKAELAHPAHGLTDGANAAFMPGSIWIHVTADVEFDKTVIPIDGYAPNEEMAFVHTSGGVFSLQNAIFSMGPLTMAASIAPSPCQEM